MTMSKLHTLLDAYVAGDVDESELAKAFERAYNFEVDLNALSESERVAFSRLFDVLGLYSPSETRAREAYRGYKSEADVRAAVRATLESLR
jgi:hypothetical protein